MSEVKDVPYIVHEGDMARMERANKRLWIVIITLIVLCVGSNIAWICYESQFEEVSTTTSEVTQEVEQENEGGGDNNFVGGDYINGETKSKDNSKNNHN